MAKQVFIKNQIPIHDQVWRKIWKEVDFVIWKQVRLNITNKITDKLTAELTHGITIDEERIFDNIWNQIRDQANEC